MGNTRKLRVHLVISIVLEAYTLPVLVGYLTSVVSLTPREGTPKADRMPLFPSIHPQKPFENPEPLR